MTNYNKQNKTLKMSKFCENQEYFINKNKLSWKFPFPSFNQNISLWDKSVMNGFLVKSMFIR